MWSLKTHSLTLFSYVPCNFSVWAHLQQWLFPLGPLVLEACLREGSSLPLLGSIGFKPIYISISPFVVPTLWEFLDPASVLGTGLGSGLSHMIFFPLKFSSCFHHSPSWVGIVSPSSAPSSMPCLTSGPCHVEAVGFSVGLCSVLKAQPWVHASGCSSPPALTLHYGFEFPLVFGIWNPPFHSFECSCDFWLFHCILSHIYMCVGEGSSMSAQTEIS